MKFVLIKLVHIGQRRTHNLLRLTAKLWVCVNLLVDYRKNWLFKRWIAAFKTG